MNLFALLLLLLLSIQKNAHGDGYVVRHRVKGKRRSKVMPTMRLARALERKWMDEAAARGVGLPVEREPLPYNELCDKFEAQHPVSERTLQTLRERLKPSRKAFGSVDVRELLSDEIAAWLAKLPKNKTKALIAMRQVLNVAVEWEYLAKNPALAVRLPSPVPKAIQPFESWEEVETVALAAKKFGGVRAQALILFACASGLRPQEWQVLRDIDIDRPGRTVHVRQTLRSGQVVANAKTTGSLRAVSLQARALEALDLLPRPINREALVFPSTEGRVIHLSNWRRRVWFEALDKAKLARRPIKEMRHTFATLALAAGVPIEWIAKQMGHTTTRVTFQHYSKWLPAADERWLDALDAFGAESSDQGGRTEDAQAGG